jgi:hypothetical protein
MLEHGGIRPETIAAIRQQRLHADVLAEIQAHQMHWFQRSVMSAVSFFWKK